MFKYVQSRCTWIMDDIACTTEAQASTVCNIQLGIQAVYRAKLHAQKSTDSPKDDRTVQHKLSQGCLTFSFREFPKAPLQINPYRSLLYMYTYYLQVGYTGSHTVQQYIHVLSRYISPHRVFAVEILPGGKITLR